MGRIRSALTVVMVAAVAVGASTPAQPAWARPTCGGKAATVVGTSGDDDLVGTRGDDVIVGLGGDDRMVGRGGDDVICGGKGWDFLLAGAGHDRVRGGPGDDLVDGGPGRDVLLGGVGADALFGRGGNDRLRGGPNPWDGTDDLAGGAGDDVLDGGRGTDRALFWEAARGVRVSLATGRARGQGTDTLTGIEGVVAGSHDDVVVGDDRPNVLIGLDGSDTIRARGSGSLRSGRADVLFGGQGDDTLDGGAGFDFVDYDRRLCAPVEVDLAVGTATGQGTDTLAGIEGAYGSECDDVLVGGSGPNAFWGGLGDDTIDGAGGSDAALYLAAWGPVNANLVTGSARGEGVGADTLLGIENLWGSGHGDRIVGDAGRNRLLGLGGDDTINAAAGDDVLDGGPGVDRLTGGTGVDRCVNGEVASQCEGP